MAIISTSTYLDGGVARTAGEAWTVNSGGQLIIRTDTRVHANAPASMTGSLGAITLSGTGSMYIDGTSVRWMAFDSGSGTVPAIGTTITQGGVSGYLLGVWANLNSAPTAVGGAMPATGFLKFREVTGGTFSAGALSGISANASSADVVGWIEVVRDQSTTLTTTMQGSGLKTRGDWFYLGTTSGSAGQIIQIPTNGGGTGTQVYAVQIETAPGSGVYEWWSGVKTSLFTTTTIGTTAACYAFESITANAGQFRIGSNGTTNIGYVPPAGCKIRMPNIILRQCTTAARASNAAPTTTAIRPSLTTTNGCIIDIQNMITDWYIYTVGPKYLNIQNSAFEGCLNIEHNLANISVSSTCISQTLAGSGGLSSFVVYNCHSGLTVSDCSFTSTNGNGVVQIDASDAITFNNGKYFRINTTSGSPITVTNTSNGVFNNIKTIGGGTSFTNCSNLSVNGHDYISFSKGATTATGSVSAVIFVTCNTITHSGLTFGFGGTIANGQPYGSIYQFNGSNLNIKLRNAGTRDNPINSGSSSTIYPDRVIYATGYSSNVTAQRLFFTGTRNGIFTTTVPQVNIFMESVYATNAVAQAFSLSEDCTLKGIGGNITPATQASYPGIHFYDNFLTNTTGRLVFLPGSLISSKSSAYVTASYDTSNALAGFTASSLILPTVGDNIIVETPYFVKGHTSFQNATPTISATNAANFVIEYDINNGSGYTGSWTTLSQANLAAQTINVAGFKMKLKVRVVTANATNAINYVYIGTNTTVTDQLNNLYPLDTATLSFTGLATGSEVRCYLGTDPSTAAEIAGVESTSGSTFSFSQSYGGQAGYIMILAMGYQPIRIPYTYKSVDDSILIQPVIDRNYNNPV